MRDTLEDATLQTREPNNTTDDSASAIRDWLNEVMIKTGMRPTPLAKAAGLAPSTLLRALDPEHPGSLERRSIEKIVQKFNVSPPPIYRESAPIRSHSQREPEILLAQRKPDAISLNPDVTQELWSINTRALELAGYLIGDLVLADSSVKPALRDVTIAKVIEHGLDTAEMVIRIYDPPYLLTETADPVARRKPLIVDNDRVTIWGTVILTARLRD